MLARTLFHYYQMWGAGQAQGWQQESIESLEHLASLGDKTSLRNGSQQERIRSGGSNQSPTQIGDYQTGPTVRWQV